MKKQSYPLCYENMEKYVFMLFQVKEIISPAAESNWPMPLQNRHMMGTAADSLSSDSPWVEYMSASQSGMSLRLNTRCFWSKWCWEVTSFWTTFLPCDGAHAMGPWALDFARGSGQIAGTQLEKLVLLMLLLLQQSLEQSGNPNCWLKIKAVVLAKAQTSKVLPFDYREWTYSVLCQAEFWISTAAINTCLPNTSVCLNWNDTIVLQGRFSV